MSKTMDDNIKRWTAKRKTALVIEIIQGFQRDLRLELTRVLLAFRQL